MPSKEKEEVVKVEIYNYDKLLGRMKEKRFTQDGLAAKIGISATSMNLSLNNKRDFKQEEILSVCDQLSIPVARIPEYFFCK